MYERVSGCDFKGGGGDGMGWDGMALLVSLLMSGCVPDMVSHKCFVRADFPQDFAKDLLKDALFFLLKELDKRECSIVGLSCERVCAE